MGDELSKICWILKLCSGKIQNKQKLYEIINEMQENKILNFEENLSPDSFIDGKPSNRNFNLYLIYLQGKCLIHADSDESMIFLSPTGERKVELFLEGNPEFRKKEAEIGSYIRTYMLV